MNSRIATAFLAIFLLVGAAAHANLPPPESDFTPGFTVTYADDRPVVETVIPGSPAAEAGIEPGFHVLAIDDLDAMMQHGYSLTRALYGFEGTQVRVIVSDATGNVTIHDLPRSVQD